MTRNSFSFTADDISILSRLISFGIADAVYNSDEETLHVFSSSVADGIASLVAEADWRSGLLASIKAELKAGIDVQAEQVRLRYITAGAGQAMTYQRKAEEARACLSDTDPVPADYPMLAAEVGITAEDLPGVAQIVNAAHEAWIAIGAQIEAARLGAKAAIEAADTVVEARLAAEAVNWL